MEEDTVLNPETTYVIAKRNMHYLLRSDEGDVEPEGETMHVARLLHGEVERHLDVVQVRLVRSLEVDCVLLRFGQTYANVECVLRKHKLSIRLRRHHTRPNTTKHATMF